MKNNPILIVLLLAIFALLNACNSKTQSTDRSHYLELYNKANDNKDVFTAIVALNEYLLNDSVVNNYHDSLAILYFLTGNFASGVIIGEKVMEKHPDNKRLAELMSEGYQKTNQYDKSIAITQKLFNDTKDYRYLYQVATLQFEDQKVKDCENTVAQILKDGLDSATTIEMSPGGLADIVPIEAACYNLKAMIEDQVNDDFATALKYFEKALKVYPAFKFPRAYIKEKQYQAYMAQGGR
jgi:tetratricopeptide (TPR) repeat protein